MGKLRYIIGCLVVGIALGGVAFAANQNQNPEVPDTFEELIQLSDEELMFFDIARMNLLCAKGLPGSEDVDVERCLKKLGRWAQHVISQEQRCFPAFFRYREKYKNSLALFKGAYLGYAIQDDFGCDYNMELFESGAMDDRTSTRFFHDSSDIFINGLIEDGKGCCSSMPVLMVALGRRCNYPFYLVGCGGHAFARWDNGTEQVNFEITNSKGIKTESDAYYRKWPRPISDKEIAEECHLKNYTGKEMLGIFASLRASCLMEHKRYNEAIQCYEVSLRAFPDSRKYPMCINYLKKKAKMGEDKFQWMARELME